MNQAFKLNNSALTNVYSFNPKSNPSWVYTMISPTPGDDEFVTFKWSAVIDRLREDDTFMELAGSDYSLCKESKWCDDEFDAFIFEHATQYADSLGYQIIRGIK